MARTTLQRYLKLLAPGTPLRAGIDRVLHGGTGALIVLGHNRQVAQVSTGGFKIDVDFTEQALRELAKLDGAIILSNDLTRILAAGVHLVPAGDLPTAETGTRHRSADRTAQVSEVPVITVSASMGTVSLFIEGRRHLVETASQVASRASQTLDALTSLTTRLHESLEQFNAAEIGDQVTIRDLIDIAYHFELARRLSAELAFHIEILGVEGRLLQLQHAQLAAPLEGLEQLLTDDYAHNLEAPEDFRLANLHNFTPQELMSSQLVAERLGFGVAPYLEASIVPRGKRLLTTVGRLPAHIVELLVPRFPVQELFALSVADLMALEGIGERRARLVRDALVRISDAALAHADRP